MARQNEASRKIAIVDGSNVARSGEAEQAKLEYITLVITRLREEGFEPLVVVGAALRHHIDEPGEYERLVETGAIRQAPAGTDADYFILAFARELDAHIVSNDRFRDREAAFAEVSDRAIRYMILTGEVVFERRARRRSGG